MNPGCDGKVRMTFVEAERKAKLSRRLTDKRFHTYHCRLCGGWHMAERQPHSKGGKDTR